MSKIALLPGGFKPPHAGHYNMAKWLSANTGADTTIIFVGPKERDGITQAMSLKLWKLYTQNDSGLEVRPAGVSPVKDVYDFIEQEAPQGSTVFLGMGEKDVSDTRFKNIPKFAEPKGIAFETKLVPPQAGGVSGTEMRGFIKMNDKALFQYSLPEHLSDKQKNEAWDIVTDLKEDLYDPRDKYYDFAKTNDPNPKKPVPNNYKYSRRNFPFRSMYERDLSDKEEKIAQDLPDKEFKKRYGKDWKSVKIATATKMAKNEGDTYEKMAAKGKKKGNLKQGTVRKRLKIKDGEKIPLSRITKAISKIKKMDNPSEKNKKYLKALNLAKTLKTTTHKESISEGPQFGVLYHFTEFLSDVLDDDRLKGPVSLTRSLDSFVPQWLGTEPYFVFDKDKLRTKYKITPFKDTSDDPDYEPISQHDEMEEIIEKDITNLARYTIKVVLPYSDENWENALKEKNIPYEIGKPLNEADPKKGTGKKPKGSKRRLYTDENPKDTVKVKFSTRQDIVDTLSKKSFKAKSHARKSQIINLIHQRVRAALSRTKDPKKKAKLRSGFEYIKKRKEASKRKTQRMKKENVFSKDWWKEQLVEVITETKANTHLTHLEELVLTQGQDGFNQAKNFLYELIKNLKGEDNTIKNVSVKWDGAPAIFTGINPDNGQFFVGTKSVFNVNPKINYTPKDIDENHGHAAGLAKKLKLALQYLPAIGIKGILQGDFMFDNDDVETEDIDGTPHYTFKPNTIKYAVEANSELGKKIIAARIGIIFHTTYNDLSGGGASFGANISGLSKSTSVWFDDAYFKDDTGILLSDQEEEFVLEKINEADSINVDYTNLPLKNLNTYINSEIRQGEFLNDPSKSFERFKNWYKRAVDKSIEKVSRPESKERKRQAGDEKLKEFESQKQDIVNIFKVSKLLSEAKAIFITKYDKAVATKHFIDNEDGTLSVTKAEGFVAVDHTENGIKLVDRLEFSKNNFNAGKPGAKK